MALSRLLGRLFGGGNAEPAAAEAIEHNGFLIYPQPIRQGGQFLTAGTIAKVYEVTDAGAHPEVVLEDLRRLVSPNK